MTNNEILERIRKLMALTESDKVGEAAAAAAKASELLHRYNLSIEDIPVERQPIDEYEKETVDYDGQQRWRRSLLEVIAKANNATSAYFSGTSKGTLIGRQHEREITIWMYGYLCREFTRLGKKAYKQDPDAKEFAPRTWYNSFYQGAVIELNRRLREMAQERMAEATSRALVLNRAGLLRQAQARLMPLTQTARRQSTQYSASAYKRGSEAGRNVSLDRPVQGGAARRQLRGN